MYPSLRRCSARVHTPLIKFLGKRTHPSGPAPRHPHPAAPTEFKDQFSQFLARMNSSQPRGSTSNSDATSSKLSTSIYSDFWQAPPRFWKPRVRELEDDEVDAIMSGGASSY